MAPFEDGLKWRLMRDETVRELESRNTVTVKCRCRNCGKKFSVRLYLKQKPGNTEIQELELDAQCPKCDSSDLEILYSY
jgi:Zn finger protein HypA/HybF involved in hydrogenase expression